MADLTGESKSEALRLVRLSLDAQVTGALRDRVQPRCRAHIAGAGFSRSVSNFRKIAKHETEVGMVHRAAYARVCDRSPLVSHQEAR